MIDFALLVLEARVFWNDPDEAECSGTGTIKDIQHIDPDEESIITLSMDSGGTAEALPAELEKVEIGVLKEALAWTLSDAEHFDEITPTLAMLEARADVLRSALPLAERRTA